MTIKVLAVDDEDDVRRLIQIKLKNDAENGWADGDFDHQARM
jgi:hypothetical protein